MNDAFKMMIHTRQCPRCGEDFQQIKWAPKDAPCVNCARKRPPPDPRDPAHHAELLRTRGLLEQRHARKAIGLEAGVDPVLRVEGPFAYAAGAVRAWMSAPAQWTLLLSGKSGCGKTTAACYAAWTMKGIFVDRPSWTRLGALERDATSRANLKAQEDAMSKRPSLVVLDDVFAIESGGAAGDDKWSSEVVWRIVMARHAAGRPTILTTNATPDGLARAYGTKGKAILTRARAGEDENGAPWKGGVVECKTP